MPGKCLGAQTEGDKCCWRGHDKQATVNLRTGGPTGGPQVDTILNDCWVGLTAHRKELTRSGKPSTGFLVLYSSIRRHKHAGIYVWLQPLLSASNVSLFLPSQLWFWWSRFLCHIWSTPFQERTQSLTEWRSLSGSTEQVSDRSSSSFSSSPSEKSSNWNERGNFPHSVGFLSLRGCHHVVSRKLWHRKENTALLFRQHWNTWLFSFVLKSNQHNECWEFTKCTESENDFPCIYFISFSQDFTRKESYYLFILFFISEYYKDFFAVLTCTMQKRELLFSTLHDNW